MRISWQPERLLSRWVRNGRWAHVVSPAALVNSAGTVLERYLYDPYGNVTVMDGAWGARSSSLYDATILFAGYWRDSETGLYHVRNRMYHVRLGLWLQRDPIGYVDGMSLYQYVGGRVTVSFDPLGLLEARFVSTPTILGGADPSTNVVYAGISFKASSAELKPGLDAGGQMYMVEKRTTTWRDGQGKVTNQDTRIYTTTIQVVGGKDGPLLKEGGAFPNGAPWAMEDGSKAANYSDGTVSLSQQNVDTDKKTTDRWIEDLQQDSLGKAETGSVEVSIEITLATGNPEEAVKTAYNVAKKKPDFPSGRGENLPERIHKGAGYSGHVPPEVPQETVVGKTTTGFTVDFRTNDSTVTGKPPIPAGPSRYGRTAEEWPGVKRFEPVGPKDKPTKWISRQ